MPNSSKTSDEHDSRNDEIVYDGNPLRFFDYDRQVTRYAKKMLGATGIKIWSDTLPTPTNANRTAISTEWVADVQDTKGYKEAGLMDADTSWKTAAKLKLKIAKFSDTLRDEIERTTTGNVKNFVQALRDEELSEMREKLKCQFAVVDASQIKSWETLLSNGIMNSTDKVFTEGLDMEKKFQELEELQNYLYNICPTQYQEEYVLGKRQSLAGIVQERLHQEYYEDVKDCIAIKAKEAGITNINTTSAAYNPALIPDYYDLRTAVLKRHAKLYPNQQKSSMPIMAIMAITQDGGGTSKDNVTCYSCGETGHYAGSKECTKPDCVAPSAPDWYRSGGSKGKGKGGPRNGKGRGKGKGNGKGNGKGKGKGKGNSQTNGSSKKPCWYFNTNGTCRQGDNCKFSHEGARGANEVSAATVRSISDRIMDSMKKGKRAQKRTQRRRDDQEEDYSDDDDDEVDNLLMNTLKNKGKKSKRTKRTVRWKESLYFTPIDSNSTEMHPKDVVGIDTDASRSISTNPQNFIPGLLDTSAEATSGITFNSAGGPRRAKGVGPMVVSTNQTQDGSPIFIIDPNGVLLESDSSNDNELTVYAQQHLKALGLPLKQQFMDGEDDVLQCRRTKRVILLSEINGILVLKKGKRQASCLTSIKNLKQLIADITNGNASPIVRH